MVHAEGPLRPDAVLTEGTNLVKPEGLPSLISHLQHVLSTRQIRLRGLAMFKVTRITNWTLLRAGKAETTGECPVTPVETPLYIFDKSPRNLGIDSCNHYLNELE